MALFLALLMLYFGGRAPCAFAAEAKSVATKSPGQSQPTTFESLVQQVIAGGAAGSLPGPLGSMIEVPAEAAYFGVLVSSEQVIDGMGHTISVLVENTSEPGTPKPLGLVLETSHKTPGAKEGYWFRASLGGDLERAALLQSKLNEQGKVIKGSGASTPKDTESPEIKKRFQHEMDLWLKKTYLKKAWRSADFSGGVLKKKGAGR